MPKGYSADHDTSDSEASVAGCVCEARFADVDVIDGPLSHDHAPHPTDEVFNAASHFSAAMLAVLGATVLITGSSAHADPWSIVAFSLYGASLIFLFGASFAHHAIKGSEMLMYVLRLMDYCAIYILIPATATPLCLVCLHNTWIGWVFFGSAWGLSAFGVLLQTTCTGRLRFPMWASMTMFITLGWFGAFLAIPAYKCIGMGGCLLFLVGGVAYTVGGAIFTMQRPNLIPGRFGFHEIWHIFVMVGAATHYAMMFFFVYPLFK